MFGDCKYRSPQIPYLDLKGHFQVGKGSIGATTIGTGGNWSPISQQVVTRMQGLHLSCQKFSGGDTPGPPQREGRLPPAPNTQPGLCPGCLGPNPSPPRLFNRCAPKREGKGEGMERKRKEGKGQKGREKQPPPT